MEWTAPASWTKEAGGSTKNQVPAWCREGAPGSLPSPPPSANGEHGRSIQRGPAQGHRRAPNRWWNSPLSGSANHQVLAWRRPTLRVAPGLAPGAGRGHGRCIQRQGWPLAPGGGTRLLALPLPRRHWRALALQTTRAGARPQASPQQVVEQT